MSRIGMMGAGLLWGLLSANLMAQDFRAPLPPQALQPEMEQSPVGGALPRVARLPSPLDAINPLLPLSYGSGADLVYYEESDPFERPKRADARPLGIRLLSFPW